MESVWWVFSELHKKGLVYQGYKVMPFSTACGTPLRYVLPSLPPSSLPPSLPPLSHILISFRSACKRPFHYHLYLYSSYLYLPPSLLPSLPPSATSKPA